MSSARSQRNTFFISTLVCALLVAILFLSDHQEPEEVQSIVGSATNVSRIENRRNLTGFRFCVGNPLVTFTYSDSDPNFASAWAAIQETGAIVRVGYETHERLNPTLWSLEIDRKAFATTAELVKVRSARFQLVLVGVCVTFAMSVAAATLWLRSGRTK
jgi:hypothetical protein